MIGYPGRHIQAGLIYGHGAGRRHRAGLVPLAGVPLILGLLVRAALLVNVGLSRLREK